MGSKDTVVDNSLPECQYIIAQCKKTMYHAGYNDLHFNSGVIWAKDDESTSTLFENWNHLWMETYQKFGIASDQTSLNEINYRLGGLINELSGSWNCQLRTGIKYLHKARIIHYFASNTDEKTVRAFAFNLADTNLWRELRETSDISVINSMLDNPKEEFQLANIIEFDTVSYIVLHSNYMPFIRWLYRAHKKAFHLIDSILGHLKKVVLHEQ